MPDLEAVGDAATGAVIARTVEPQAGEADGHTHERNCLNCGTELAGDYCHACGQKAQIHRTIAAWWHDFLHSVLHLDGKFWRTLPMLAWRPGELTRRYVHGERAKFVSPLALFLFSAFLMLAVFSATDAKIGDPTGIQAGVRNEIRSTETKVSTLERQRADAARAGQPTDAINRQLSGAREELAALRRVEGEGVRILAGERMPVRESVEVNLSDGTAGLGYLDEAYRKAKQNPSLLVYKLQNNAYKFSWALIPLSVPFLWLLFLHRRRYRQQFSGYDHFVFITYSIAAMSLALVLFVLLTMIGIDSGLLTLALVIFAPTHIYRQLRGAYHLTYWSAAWRTLALLCFALVVLMLFGLMLLTMGIFG